MICCSLLLSGSNFNYTHCKVYKEIKAVNLKGNQPWMFIGRTDVEADALVLWPSEAKSQLTGKDPDGGKDWRQEKGTTEDEMVGWHHQLDGCEFAQTPGDRDGQGGLVCCRPWGHKESDTTEWLNWTELILLKDKFLLLENLLTNPVILKYILWEWVW